MEKKGFIGKLKILSKPAGNPQWKKAAKSIILMFLAALIAKMIGFDNGLRAVLFITLIATIIIDLPLPIRKIIPLALAGFLMTFLAFVSSSLALSSLPVFLFFTVVWAFFSLSLYIFNENAGLFGFMIFTGYFMSVLLVNNYVSPLNWGLYIVLAYLVASILLIPKFIHDKDDILKMVASPYDPQTSLEKVLRTRQALSGVPLSKRNYELFRIGTYLNGFRSFGELILSRLSGESKDIFSRFMETASQSSSEISRSISNHEKEFDLKPIDEEIVKLQESTDDRSMNAVLDVAHNIRSFFRRVKELLAEEETSSITMKIKSPRDSLQEVLKANFNLHNMYIRHALRFTLAMTLGLLAVYLTHERSAIWITMGILIIIKPDVTSTFNNMISRVSYNFIAILLAIVLGFIFPHQILVWIAIIMLFFFRAFYPTYISLSVIAMTVFVVLIWPGGTVFENAVARIIDISIGAIIAFICAYLILPSRITVDLPGQIARTIRANQEYVKAVIPTEEMFYDHETAVKYFRKYSLEEKNLESAIKKVDDTFNDVGDDVSLFNKIGTANHKLAADISTLPALIESGATLPDISRFKEHLIDALNELALSVDKNVVLPRANIDGYYGSDGRQVNLENYLDWIISDVKFLQEAVEIGHQTGALKKYRDMT
ncbi:MAG TPA: FUSC family protein [Methanobacterium sp.]|jgi:uncharacterized membrane protein YccC|nr:FUSC family protein [Methanobacterium sp.]